MTALLSERATAASVAGWGGGEAERGSVAFFTTFPWNSKVQSCLVTLANEIHSNFDEIVYTLKKSNNQTKHHSCISSNCWKYVDKNVVHCKAKAQLYRALWLLE